MLDSNISGVVLVEGVESRNVPSVVKRCMCVSSYTCWIRGGLAALSFHVHGAGSIVH